MDETPSPSVRPSAGPLARLAARLPALLLAVVAIALVAVIAARVSADADPAPQDTTPIVITPAADGTPTTGPDLAPGSGTDDDLFDRTVPAPRDYDDDDDDRDDD